MLPFTMEKGDVRKLSQEETEMKKIKPVKCWVHVDRLSGFVFISTADRIKSCMIRHHNYKILPAILTVVPRRKARTGSLVKRKK